MGEKKETEIHLIQKVTIFLIFYDVTFLVINTLTMWGMILEENSFTSWGRTLWMKRKKKKKKEKKIQEVLIKVLPWPSQTQMLGIQIPLSHLKSPRVQSVVWKKYANYVSISFVSKSSFERVQLDEFEWMEESRWSLVR